MHRKLIQRLPGGWHRRTNLIFEPPANFALSQFPINGMRSATLAMTSQGLNRSDRIDKTNLSGKNEKNDSHSGNGSRD